MFSLSKNNKICDQAMKFHSLGNEKYLKVYISSLIAHFYDCSSPELQYIVGWKFLFFSI